MNLNIEDPIKGELFSIERLEEYSAYLAHHIKISKNPGINIRLLDRMRENSQELFLAYQLLLDAINKKEVITPAAEWLTENFHIVEDQLREIQKDLPDSYYKELPKISHGELKGYPRIYAISLMIVAHTDSLIEINNLRKIILAYQKVSPLTMGELWALPITLRLVLIENLRRISADILISQKMRKSANDFADRILDSVGIKKNLQKIILELQISNQSTLLRNCHYYTQIAKRLRDQEPGAWNALEYLELQLFKNDQSIDKLVHYSHEIQASRQVSIANTITSMRLLSSIKWYDFFESVNEIDRILEKDLIYSQMDFVTRDFYRHQVEKISKRTIFSEIEISHKVLEISLEASKNEPTNKKKSHIGYYLIDQGENEFHKQVQFKPIRNLYWYFKKYPTQGYFGLILIISFILLYFPIRYSLQFNLSSFSLWGIGILLLPLTLELSIQLTNYLLTYLLPPLPLPRLDFSKSIPLEARTFVVIPCLFFSKQIINDLLEKLEIHYLSNSEEELYFALLSDFSDAPQEEMESDELFLEQAKKGIENLNRKYGFLTKTKFFLFHRKRLWNPIEKQWMGWERKRGKIHEFNRLLRGDTETSFVIDLLKFEFLKSIQFVLTLDADTQLPRDTANKLIGTLRHPLNQPVYNENYGRVTEGFAILQPRIGISLESSVKTYFSKIFSGYIGSDSYNTNVSEIYQDLFNEACYTGKGLYEVDHFEKSLKNRIPENRVLSHDLFEGLYARTGLVNDVELIDDYPSSYSAYCLRNHRWIRGDWQIASWIRGCVPHNGPSKVKNQLPWISRWKIFDNLRRSLFTQCLFIYFILGWIALPGSPLFWFSYGILIRGLPWLIKLMFQLCHFQIGLELYRWRSFLQKVAFSLSQILLEFLILPHQTIVQTDAIVRSLYRTYFSKKLMLEWKSSDAQIKSHDRLDLWKSPWFTESILLGLLIFTFLNHWVNWQGLSLFIFFWMSFPWITQWLNHPWKNQCPPFNLVEIDFLREIALRTWSYFEIFVTHEQNWLPPDNHQEFPVALTASRTSPTNIGLYLSSLISARDFGYITRTQFIKRFLSSIETLKKMELFKGHYLNWYDTKSLKPLLPKYVSTVDSGNFATCLISSYQSIIEFSNESALTKIEFKGLYDLILAFQSDFQKNPIVSKELELLLSQLKSELSFKSLNTLKDYEEQIIFIEKSFNDLLRISEKLEIGKDSSPSSQNILYWINQGLFLINDLKLELLNLFPWSQFLKNAEITNLLGSQFIDQLNDPLKLRELESKYILLYNELKFHQSRLKITELLYQQIDRALIQLNDSKIYLQDLLSSFTEISDFLNSQFIDMNFTFLLDPEREIFRIGFNVSEGKMDSGFYDLLASESRLASFMAIAKGDISQDHWNRLGRQLVPTTKGRALVSWTGSMFEYLMPNLFMFDYENTLISETLHSVVEKQIEYGKMHRVPWGVSEAGYNTRDLQYNYQYGPFGMPGLGLKSGLCLDLVVSPYSTALASLIEPKAAIENFKVLKKMNLLRTFGFYEAIDFTADRIPKGEAQSIVKSFMAHHQGMTLVALNNLIHSNKVQIRFHRDPRIKASHTLLQEKIPDSKVTTLPWRAQMSQGPHDHSLVDSLIRHINDPSKFMPQSQLISNKNYSVMITSAGGGYSKWNQMAVTRWSEDSTRDSMGTFIFIKDLDRKKIWSSTFQPLCDWPQAYLVHFGEDKVTFNRRENDISTETQILVTPEDNVELRLISLINESDEERNIEVTSYLEPVMRHPKDDANHPAFSKLFIETEFLTTKSALVAKRRRRTKTETDVWIFHNVVTNSSEDLNLDKKTLQFETDRSLFIGRGRTLSSSLAHHFDSNLSNKTGAPIDPILSLRVRILIPPRSSKQIVFSIGISTSREEILSFADRYHDIHCFERESKMSWTKQQADLRHLNIDSETAILFQQIGEQILFRNSNMTKSDLGSKKHVSSNAKSSLWPQGISGDLPILLLRIDSSRDIGVLKNLFHCQEYLRWKGLSYDFVIINDHESTYLQGLNDEIFQQMRISGSLSWHNKLGGIFILRKDLLTSKDLSYIQYIAHICFFAEQPIKEQMTRKIYPRRETRNRKFKHQKTYSQSEKFKEPLTSHSKELSHLLFFNGFGGFDEKSGEYKIILQNKQWPPAPWINVIGNTLGFGFQVSESGSGYTWSQNSQTNRLTPWSNDPVIDPSGDILYLKNNLSEEIWTPTPLPIRRTEPYIIKHGKGYSVFEHNNIYLNHELTQFVPNNENLKISILKISNKSFKNQNFTLTSYIEWVLGNQRNQTAPFIITEFDFESNTTFARNPAHNEYFEKISYHCVAVPMGNLNESTFTSSRKEFLGRNGDYQEPLALRSKGLSNSAYTSYDPCSAIQNQFELESGESLEIIILLGQCESKEIAIEKIKFFRILKNAHQALLDVKTSWSKVLNKIQVKTPEPSLDILVNSWLLYQNLSCRYWSRTGFYQSGGAYGFRDQLQDSMGLVYSKPELTREHILRASHQQFSEGDVQHWWHPPFGLGLRSRTSDDRLWLPFVVSFYISITGDISILEEKISFLKAPLLREDEVDSLGTPPSTDEKYTLFEHCCRAIDRSLILGKHNLPVIGTGDWNDGLNQVGIQGAGESVWLGWFLCKVIDDFSSFYKLSEDDFRKNLWHSHRERVIAAIESDGWDGNWYRRAFFDDSSILGSAMNEECKIDSLSQTWAILSQLSNPERSREAMKNFYLHLVNKESQTILLLTPPFDKGSTEPGYIKGYIPGVRENGGQYTHAAIWAIMAYAEIGDGDKALELFNLLNPIHHSDSLEKVQIYKIEPYVIAADVYFGNAHNGRGGWSWYTGSASWYYRSALESILGFKLHGDKLSITPCIPKNWTEFEIIYEFRNSIYEIKILNPSGLSIGRTDLVLDGKSLNTCDLSLKDDGIRHQVIGTMIST